MTDWIVKDGYETKTLADSKDLNQEETQIQLVRFHKGKYAHHHKIKTEFFYFLKGKGKAVVDEKMISLSAGVTVLVRPNTMHTFINESDEPLEAIMFKTKHTKEDTFTSK
ncbi:MAG: cupin domain-containing protein [archaeon]